MNKLSHPEVSKPRKSGQCVINGVIDHDAVLPRKVAKCAAPTYSQQPIMDSTDDLPRNYNTSDKTKSHNRGRGNSSNKSYRSLAAQHSMNSDYFFSPFSNDSDNDHEDNDVLQVLLEQIQQPTPPIRR